MATVAHSSLVEQMEELLRCPICHETLKEPRTLRCFHSFCKDCLAKHVKSYEEEVEDGHQHLFCCPMCRTKFRWGQSFEGGVEEMLKPNFLMNNLLEMLSIQKGTANLLCQSCTREVAAACKCADCDRYLCEDCLTAHNNWPALRCHRVFTLEELKKPENQGKAKPKKQCNKEGHENKPFEYYCDSCERLACINCVLIDHPQPKHTHKLIAVVAKQQKEDLQTTSALLIEKFDEAQTALQEIKAASQNLKDNNEKAKASIVQCEKEILEEFTSRLKCHTAALIVESEKKHNEVNQKLVKQHDGVKVYVEKINGLLAFLKYSIETGSNVDIVSLGNLMKLNANDIEKECPKFMEPAHHGYFEFIQKKSTQEIVETVNLSDLGRIVDPVGPLLGTSTILNGNIVLVRTLVKWLESDRFGWQLCYRATDDGWNALDFHRKCNDVGPTVTLVKCGICVFGGYTDQSWGLNNQDSFASYKRSKISFLFSLRNKDNISPFKCPINNYQTDKAIFSNLYWGATFGGGYGGYDLHISSNANTNQDSYSNLGDTYQPPPGYERGTPQTKALLAGREHFTPTEIEVFVVNHFDRLAYTPVNAPFYVFESEH